MRLGLNYPIILNNIIVIFTGDTDLSNATTIGLVTYDISPTGVITIAASQDQLSAISQFGVIYLVPESETSPVFDTSNLAESGSAVVYAGPAAHIQIESLSS